LASAVTIIVEVSSVEVLSEPRLYSNQQAHVGLVHLGDVVFLVYLVCLVSLVVLVSFLARLARQTK
jgi:glycopeptide antibiotics resistance protein